MLKRILALVLTAMLAVTPACAENDIPEALYLLVSRDASGAETPLGSAVLFADQSTLLTTSWVLLQASGQLFAVGAGGTLPVSAQVTGTGQNELVLLHLEAPSPAAPMDLSTGSGAPRVAGYHGTQACCQDIGFTSFIPYRESTALLYTSPTALLPAAILLDDQNCLAGITLAAYGEGVNRYVAISAADIVTASRQVQWLTDFSLTQEAGWATVDWSGSAVDCRQDNCVTSVFYTDTANIYYSYLIPVEGQRVDFPLVPGRTYRVWVQHAHQETDHYATRDESTSALITAAAAEPFAMYDYKDAEIYLAAAPLKNREAVVNTYLPPLEPITAEALNISLSAIFLQVESSYTVDRNTDTDLLVTLTTPENYSFVTLYGFTFDTSLQEKDIWNVDITDLLADYMQFSTSQSLTPGEYTVSYYLGGALANSFTWTLE